MCKLIAGHLQGLPFAEPKDFSATGERDETGVDLQSHAHIIFSDSIEAKISCAINENFANDLVISSGNKFISANQPWHCGQFQDGKSSILVSTPDLGKKKFHLLMNLVYFPEKLSMPRVAYCSKKQNRSLSLILKRKVICFGWINGEKE